jgi:signal peptide peptidase SppA
MRTPVFVRAGQGAGCDPSKDLSELLVALRTAARAKRTGRKVRSNLLLLQVPNQNVFVFKMKYHQIISTLTSEPLLIAPASAIALLELFKQHSTLSAEEFRAQREGTGQCGEKVDLEQMIVEDGFAHIPIAGPIGKGLASFEKGAGGVDVADVTDELDQAEDNDEVRTIILHFDSPGGMVSGTPELADRIAGVEKPIYSFTDGLIASAAYWLAAATDGIFATKSADIGSIGVYIPWADFSELYKKEGIKIELFTSGKYKGMGFPGTSLSKDQRDLLKDRVVDIAQMFYAHVQHNRPDVQDEDMQGQTFKADQAAARGLIDQVVRDKDEMMAVL